MYKLAPINWAWFEIVLWFMLLCNKTHKKQPSKWSHTHNILSCVFSLCRRVNLFPLVAMQQRASDAAASARFISLWLALTLSTFAGFILYIIWWESIAAAAGNACQNRLYATGTVYLTRGLYNLDPSVHQREPPAVALHLALPAFDSAARRTDAGHKGTINIQFTAQ